jgi:CubicO group peptidase (beta-lactamase class C family)
MIHARPGEARRRCVRAVPLLAAALALLAAAAGPGRAADRAAADLPRALDEVMQAHYKPDAPGAAVIVIRGGKTLLREGYGLADLELGVPIRPEMPFRLGSITKQFTAVAVLMLVEEGKLSLSDTLGRFLPGYPTHGHHITVEHLLTHTSGIKSYTDMATWPQVRRHDLSVRELVDYFKNEPMDFAPGTRWQYDNSGYVLLGAIIEKAAGMPYAQFVEKRIFEPLGMAHSCYDTTERIVPGRVRGYTPAAGGFRNADFVSMSQPYAAGGLMSSVDDLARWNAALLDGKLVKPETLRHAWTSSKLEDGRETRYGYGWFIGSLAGHRTLEHGGGINGFSTYEVAVPDAAVYVALLTNTDSAPTPVAEVGLQLAALASGSPPEKPKTLALAPEALDTYVGVYAVEDGAERVITREGDQLVSQRTGGPRFKLIPVAADEFTVAETDTRFRFQRDAGGKITGMEVDRRIGPLEQAQRTEKPLPKERVAIALDPALLDRYVGQYDLAPGMSLTVTRAGDRLMAQVTGQPQLEIFPESETQFFYKAVDAQVEFVRDPAGVVVSLIVHQGGRDVPAKKVR